MNDTDPIVWTGDLDDDCTATWHGFVARAECMGSVRIGKKKERRRQQYWWVAVYTEETGADLLDDKCEPDICLISGRGARFFCELSLRLHDAERRLKGEPC